MSSPNLESSLGKLSKFGELIETTFQVTWDTFLKNLFRCQQYFNAWFFWSWMEPCTKCAGWNVTIITGLLTNFWETLIDSWQNPDGPLTDLPMDLLTDPHTDTPMDPRWTSDRPPDGPPIDPQIDNGIIWGRAFVQKIWNSYVWFKMLPQKESNPIVLLVGKVS